MEQIKNVASLISIGFLAMCGMRIAEYMIPPKPIRLESITCVVFAGSKHVECGDPKAIITGKRGAA